MLVDCLLWGLLVNMFDITEVGYIFMSSWGGPPHRGLEQAKFDGPPVQATSSEVIPKGWYMLHSNVHAFSVLLCIHTSMCTWPYPLHKISIIQWLALHNLFWKLVVVHNTQPRLKHGLLLSTLQLACVGYFPVIHTLPCVVIPTNNIVTYFILTNSIVNILWLVYSHNTSCSLESSLPYVLTNNNKHIGLSPFMGISTLSSDSINVGPSSRS